MPHSHLTVASLSTLRQLFTTLPPAGADLRYGFFRACFIGPAWLRLSAGPSVALSGLPGWQGKRFLDSTEATNILLRHGKVQEKYRMQCSERPSMIDGRPGVDLSYGEHGPIPWRWVRDELRVLDENTLLGMTVIDLPLLRRLTFPFLLSRKLESGL